MKSDWPKTRLAVAARSVAWPWRGGAAQPPSTIKPAHIRRKMRLMVVLLVTFSRQTLRLPGASDRPTISALHLDREVVQLLWAANRHRTVHGRDTSGKKTRWAAISPMFSVTSTTCGLPVTPAALNVICVV